MTDSTPTPPEDDRSADLDDATNATLDALEDALDAARERQPDVPGWEFCDGLLTALVCTRRVVDEDEWAPALFGDAGLDVFGSAAERTRFVMHWLARESQIRAALQAPVDLLDDARALAPAAMDWRGLLVTLPDDERAEATADGPPPALARDWARGFLHAVEVWADDWAPPRDKDIADAMGDALDCIAALAEDDRDPPTMNLYDPDAAPSTSEARFEAFGEAIWAAYDLHDIARSLGPRVAPVQSSKVGRNDPCPCGSGKKFKKCCGA